MAIEPFAAFVGWVAAAGFAVAFRAAASRTLAGAWPDAGNGLVAQNARARPFSRPHAILDPLRSLIALSCSMCSRPRAGESVRPSIGVMRPEVDLLPVVSSRYRRIGNGS